MTPALALVLQTVGSAALVVASMIAIGLELRPADLSRLRARPRMLAVVLVVNLFLVPVLAWLVVRSLGLGPETALGVMLCAAAPGGPTAALYASNARADLGLAAGMTIVLPLIGVVSTPLTLSLCAELPAGASVPVGPMIASLLTLQVVPLGLAVSLRRRRPALAARLAPWASRAANGVLGLMVVGLLAVKGQLVFELSASTWIALLGITALALVLGYLGAALPEPKRPARPASPSDGDPRAAPRSAALIAACRNISVGIMLASTFVRDPIVDATVLGFGLVGVLVPLGVSLAWRRRPGPEPRPEFAGPDPDVA